jgi:hypothetical protein
VVALFDNLCIDGKCVSNTNPTLRPLPKAAFAHAFEAAQTSTGFNPQIACIEVHGRWYVQLGTGSSPVPPQ